jgi:hypothetical protein
MGEFNEPTSLPGCHSTRASRRIPILILAAESRAIFKLTRYEKLRGIDRIGRPDASNARPGGVFLRG